MSVYVDDMKAVYGRMVMCHMIADSIEELHAMAEKIGVHRKWYQGKPENPHYDICASKKKAALDYGAIPITQRDSVILQRKNFGGHVCGLSGYNPMLGDICPACVRMQKPV